MNTKRFFSLVLGAAVAVSVLFAGDVAAFEDLGISADGTVYLFAQYGVTDKTYQGYAEIYAVDIAANDFVPNGIKETAASKKTAGLAGRTVYEGLAKANEKWLDSWNARPAGIGNTLYVRADSRKKATETISVTDFEHSTTENPVSYTFTLVPTIEKKGSSVSSSFYINVEKKDAAGAVVARKVAGTPSVKRKGVTGYAIEKIMVDGSGSRFVVVVEKTSDSATGPSVRYMVETFVIQ